MLNFWCMLFTILGIYSLFEGDNLSAALAFTFALIEHKTVIDWVSLNNYQNYRLGLTIVLGVICLVRLI